MTVASETSRAAMVGEELAKLPAFARRDLLDAWSYRTAFFADVGGMIFQILTFYFVGRLIDESVLPSYGGREVSYISFVAVGIAISVFVQVGLQRVASALRTEQFKGTLESLLMTPTALTTVQLGSAVYDLIYVPLRTLVFLLAVTLMFGLDIEGSGLIPSAVIVLAFVPFVWGLGLIAAGSVLTFKRSELGVGFGVALLTLSSGAYFPLSVLPGWLEAIASINPLYVAIEGAREALLGGSGWAEVPEAVAVLVPCSAVGMLAGVLAFRAALARERRIGTLSLY